MKQLTAVFLVFLFNLSPLQPQKSASQPAAPAARYAASAELVTLTNTWTDAINAKDHAKLEALLAPEFALYRWNGEVLSHRPQWLDNLDHIKIKEYTVRMSAREPTANLPWSLPFALGPVLGPVPTATLPSITNQSWWTPGAAPTESGKSSPAAAARQLTPRLIHPARVTADSLRRPALRSFRQLTPRLIHPALVTVDSLRRAALSSFRSSSLPRVIHQPRPVIPRPRQRTRNLLLLAQVSSAGGVHFRTAPKFRYATLRP
jgi:hypothetical protein